MCHGKPISVCTEIVGKELNSFRSRRDGRWLQRIQLKPFPAHLDATGKRLFLLNRSSYEWVNVKELFPARPEEPTKNGETAGQSASPGPPKTSRSKMSHTIFELPSDVRATLASVPASLAEVPEANKKSLWGSYFQPLAKAVAKVPTQPYHGHHFKLVARYPTGTDEQILEEIRTGRCANWEPLDGATFWAWMEGVEKQRAELQSRLAKTPAQEKKLLEDALKEKASLEKKLNDLRAALGREEDVVKALDAAVVQLKQNLNHAEIVIVDAAVRIAKQSGVEYMEQVLGLIRENNNDLMHQLGAIAISTESASTWAQVWGRTSKFSKEQWGKIREAGKVAMDRVKAILKTLKSKVEVAANETATYWTSLKGVASTSYEMVKARMELVWASSSSFFDRVWSIFASAVHVVRGAMAVGLSFLVGWFEAGRKFARWVAGPIIIAEVKAQNEGTQTGGGDDHLDA